MTVKDIFERVLMQTEITEQRFCEYFNECVSFLASQYGEKYVVGEHGTTEGIKAAEDASDLLEDYYACVPDYILFRLGGESNYQLFMINSKNAYLNVWRKTSKGKRVLPRLGGGKYV